MAAIADDLQNHWAGALVCDQKGPSPAYISFAYWGKDPRTGRNVRTGISTPPQLIAEKSVTLIADIFSRRPSLLFGRVAPTAFFGDPTSRGV
jgi:hypothetical protein